MGDKHNDMASFRMVNIMSLVPMRFFLSLNMNILTETEFV